MKLFYAFAFSVASALPSTSFAADAPVEFVPQLNNKVSVYDWSGFYIGFGGGTGYLLETVSAPALGVSSVSGVSGRGFFGKLTVGRDFQFSNGFVAGVEVSGRYGDVETSWNVPPVPFAGSVTADYGFDVVGRVGYTITPRTLAYLLGGYSWQHFDLDITTGAGSTTWNESGFVVGFGLERAIRDNWTWGSEYRYSQYSGETIAALGGVSIDPVTHSFNTNINYRFDGGPSEIQRDAFSYDWSGLKLGGAVSVGMAYNKINVPLAATSFDGLGTEGFLGEVNIGYDWELRERLVAGVILAAEYVGFSSSLSALGVTVTSDADDLGFDALLRGGYKFGDYVLGYVVGGYTYQNLSASATGFGTSASVDVGVNALTIGTGTELALSERTSAYIEYRYTMYEDVDVGTLVTLEPSSHTVRVGAKFKLFSN
ncbi:MAG: outer membrane beta-barrel protein [Pseudomonadota bacterium]